MMGLEAAGDWSAYSPLSACAYERFSGRREEGWVRVDGVVKLAAITPVWQPITTAPRDKVLDLWDGRERLIGCRWGENAQVDNIFTVAPPPYTGWTWCDRDGSVWPIAATHWMLPPDLPEESS